MKKLLLIPFLLWAGGSFGQNGLRSWSAGESDSIRQVIRTTAGRERADALNALAGGLVFTDTLESQRAAEQALALSRAIGYPVGEEIALLHLRLLRATRELEYARKQGAISAQRSRREAVELTRTWLAFGGTALLLVVAGLLFVSHLRRTRAESEQKALALEQKLLRSQMNPHFIFNMLSGIQQLILFEEPVKAGIYLSEFSSLVRHILENSREDFVPLQQEIDTLQTYLKLQGIRFEGKFEYEIRVDPELDTENSWIPPMLAQPFIENALEHGIRHKQTPGHIRVSFRKEDGLLRFEVEDDGIGREKALERAARESADHRPLATSITAERLSLLKRKRQVRIRMEITDLKNAVGEAAGTRVTFAIPLQDT